MIKIYLARGMTGRLKSDVVKEALIQKDFLTACGFKVLCPVTEEQVKAENKPLQATYEHMVKYWKRDKEMIREAHVVMDMTPHLRSVGVAHETAYARYHLWKKVIRLYPFGQLPPKSSIGYFEDDFITDEILDAVGEIYRTHGSLFKRLKWRFTLYRRCLVKAFYYKLREWK